MTSPATAEDSTAVFERHRKRLFGLAYRMLATVGDAEDAVQDTWLRWHRVDTATIQTPEAWLVTACTRICIDRLRAAKTEREHYTGIWLPEPLVELDVAPMPGQVPGEMADDLSMALLVVLERLTPAERAAYLLREAFDYDYPQIATILKKPKQPAASWSAGHRSICVRRGRVLPRMPRRPGGWRKNSLPPRRQAMSRPLPACWLRMRCCGRMVVARQVRR